MSTIIEHMTPSPHTIGSDQSVAEALRRMREHHCRHLPVLEGGKLAGIISARDATIVELVEAEQAEKLKVSEVMSPEVYVVEPDADLAAVVATMANRKIGSAIIARRDRVLGIFTTTDALSLLARWLVVEELRETRGQ